MKFPDAEQRLWDQMMAYIERLREEFGEGFVLGDIVLAADVIAPGNPITIHGSDPRYWVQQALLEQAAVVAEEAQERCAPVLDEPDDD